MIDEAEADAIAERVNRYGIGPWLLGLLGRLGSGVPNGLAIPRDRATVDASREGLRLTLYRRAEAGVPHWSDAVVLERVRFDAAAGALPFGLDATLETPATARDKLSDDTAGAGARVSHFLPDGRVVELMFQSGSRGVSEVLVARLGAELRMPDLGAP